MKFTLTISAAVMALLTLATAAPTAEQSAPAANVLDAANDPPMACYNIYCNPEVYGDSQCKNHGCSKCVVGVNKCR